MKILPIRQNPGHNDQLSHTLRHFVAVDAEMDRLPPDDALRAHQARFILVEAGASEHDIHSISRHHEHLPRRWGRYRPVVARIHDQGYEPRYRRQAERGGQPGSRGSGWTRQPGYGSRRWRLSRTHPSGAKIRLAADWNPKRHELQMVTAYVRGLTAPAPASEPDDYFAQLHRYFAQLHRRMRKKH